MAALRADGWGEETEPQCSHPPHTEPAPHPIQKNYVRTNKRLVRACCSRSELSLPRWGKVAQSDGWGVLIRYRFSSVARKSSPIACTKYFFFIKFGKYPSFFVYLQSKYRAKYFIGYVLEDFRFAKNYILKGASSAALRHLPPPGKADIECANIAFCFLCILLFDW